MRKLTSFARLLLFISSYIPLSLIFIVIDFKSLSFPFFKHSLLVLSLIIISIISLLALLEILKDKSSDSSALTYKIVSRDNLDSEVLSYIFTYILPFLGFPEEKAFIIIPLVLITFGILYLHSNMIGINPMLSLFGYHLVKIEFSKDGCSNIKDGYMITKISPSDLNKETTINVSIIHENIYLINKIM